MPSAITLPPNAPVHPDDAVSGVKSLKLQTPQASAVPTTKTPEPQKAPEFNFKADSLALSFAYDSVAKSLNIVMTDKTSGEIIRKITYTHIPPDVHQADKLHGLLLDQLA
jgi:uncharacterized FlaG/YvyC family protein